MTSHKMLPETWDDVVYYRNTELKRETLRRFFTGELMIEGCIECPCLQTAVNGNRVITRCIANKCIKQYPHILDNEAFK